MANTESNQEVPSYRFLNNYKFKYLTDEKSIGQVKVYQEKGTNNQIFVKEIDLQEDGNTMMYYTNLLKDKRYKSNVFITIDCVFLNKDDNMFCSVVCDGGKYNRLIVSMEFTEDSLLSEINERARTRLFYEEDEIWVLLERIIIMEKHYVSNLNRVHGNQKPENIFLNSTDEIKFVDTSIIDYKLDCFLKTKFGMSNYPLSPEQLHYIRYNIEQDYDRQAAEVWSIGNFF